MTETKATASTSNALLLQKSKDKLEAVAEALKPWISNHDNNHLHNTVRLLSLSQQQQPHQQPQPVEAYRCRCSFQLLWLPEEFNWRYAIRKDQQPIVIDSFPIANRHIQKAMHRLLYELNDKNNNKSNNGNNSNNGKNLTHHLTSVSFSSPWKDDDDDDDSDSRIGSSVAAALVVVVTLHYDGPIADEFSWQEQARRICQTCGFSQLTGRSKKVIVRAFPEQDEEDGPEISAANSSSTSNTRRPSSIYDTLWLETRNHEERSSSPLYWNVTFSNKPCCTKDDDDDDGDHDHDDGAMLRIPVHYCKPEGAFFHPNASVMMLALDWLLNRVQYIIHSTTTRNTNAQQAAQAQAAGALPNKNRHHIQRPRLLELYCGCGAHTMPLALSRLLSHITALELDDRLVRALRHNCRLNNLVLASDEVNPNDDKKQRNDNDDSGSTKNSHQPEECTVVECISSDAGAWAREQQQKKTQRQRRRQQQDDNDSWCARHEDDDLEYDILLVDPPRNGLDEQVCQLALQKCGSTNANATGTLSTVRAAFSHILYISCGKQALVRDLERLSAGYELVDCALLDLFPSTEAVETLVHLQRRQDEHLANSDKPV